MAKDETKVFDVAKPGEAKPQTGAKPMVVGHKLMKDPSVSDTESNEEKDDSEQQPIAQTTKRTIIPLSEQDKSTDVEPSAEKEEAGAEEVKPEEAKEEKTEPESKNDSGDSKQDENDSNKIEDNTPSAAVQKNAEEALNNEENLQRIVNEKTYNVSIKEASYSGAKSFLKTFLIVGILAAVTIALLIDAEILDLGIDLPFDFL